MLFSYLLLLHRINVDLSLKCQGSCKSFLHPVSIMSWREQDIIQNLLKQPNLLLRPTSPDKRNRTETKPPPVVIWTSLHLEGVSTIKEQNMEFKAQFRFQQEWNDSRFVFNDKKFPKIDYVRFAKDQMEAVWRPDTFFQNEKDGHYHSEDQPNFLFLVSSNGSVIYNRRLTMTFSCVMDFLRYPMDTQRCEIDFASYAYTTSDIVYVWKNRPLTIYHGAKSMLPNFVIRSFTNATCTSITNTGEYSCLEIVLRLQRDFSFFLLQVYLPSTTLVAVAWVSYWIDWQATAARFPLVLFTLLTMITQSHAVNANLPPVSYTRAIDVWSGACIMFIFTSLIEYAFVNYSGIKDMKPKSYGVDKYYQGDFGCHVWDKLIAWGRQKNRYLVEHLFNTDTSFSTTFTSGDRGFIRRRFGRRNKRANYDCRLASIDSTDHYYDLSINRSSCTSSTLGHRDGKRISSLANSSFDEQSESGPRIRLCTKRRVDVLKLCHMLKARNRAERIDFMFRILYPTAFGMFNVVYWAVYW